MYAGFSPNRSDSFARRIFTAFRSLYLTFPPERRKHPRYPRVATAITPISTSEKPRLRSGARALLLCNFTSGHPNSMSRTPQEPGRKLPLGAGPASGSCRAAQNAMIIQCRAAGRIAQPAEASLGARGGKDSNQSFFPEFDQSDVPGLRRRVAVASGPALRPGQRRRTLHPVLREATLFASQRTRNVV